MAPAIVGTLVVLAPPASVAIGSVLLSTTPAPSGLSASPEGPANDNSPEIRGTADQYSTVSVYADSTCTGEALATGSAGDFADPGLTVTVPDDSATTFYAAATASESVSDCSPDPATYVEDSTAPATSDDVPAGQQDSAVTVTLTATDASAGVDATYYTHGISPADPTTASAVYDASSKPNLSDGERIKYFSVDSAGNAEAVKTSPTLKVKAAEPAPTPPAGGDEVVVDSPDKSCATEVFGTVARDRIYGSGSSDLIHGFDGDDTLYGLVGIDCLEGGAGDDRLWGNAGDDWLWGGLGDDRLHGRAGDDKLRSEQGNDYLAGRDGDDSLKGGPGDDTLRGHEGDDYLSGGDGNDWLNAGRGTNRYHGRGGDDFISARNGVAETVDCGSGADAARVDLVDRTAGCETIQRD